jgi:hypothetical protein
MGTVTVDCGDVVVTAVTVMRLRLRLRLKSGSRC